MRGAEVIEAVVQVDGVETSYLRCGGGARVIVVLAENATERLRLLQRFSSEFRVIAPVPRAPATGVLEATALEVWLRGVIDGLGLNRPTIALSPALAGLAAPLVASCGDAVDAVLAVTPPDSS